MKNALNRPPKYQLLLPVQQPQPIQPQILTLTGLVHREVVFNQYILQFLNLFRHPLFSQSPVLPSGSVPAFSHISPKATESSQEPPLIESDFDINKILAV